MANEFVKQVRIDPGSSIETLDRLVQKEREFGEQTKRTTESTDKATTSERQREQAVEETTRELERKQRVERDATDATEEHTKATRESVESNRGFGESVTGVLGNLRGLVSGITATGGVLWAYRQIREELELIKRLQSEAFREQVTLASAQRDLRLNLVGEGPEAFDRAMAAAQDISTTTGAPMEHVIAGIAEATAATAGDLDRAIANTRLGFQVRPDRPGEAGLTAGAIGDIGNAIGAPDDAMRALGFLLQVGTVARIQQFPRLTRNVPRAITGLTGVGFAPEEAGAFYAALTNASGDVTGEQSATASINFGRQLEAFFLERQRPERGTAAIRALQNDPALNAAFMEGLAIEAAAFAPIRSLVTDPSSRFARMVESNLAQFGNAGAMRALASETLTGLNSGDVEATARIARQMDVTAQQLRLSDIGGGRTGAIRDRLIPVLQAGGMGDLASDLAGLEFELSGGESLDVLIDILEQHARRLGSPRAVSGGVGAPGVMVGPSPRAMQQSQILRRNVEQLEAMQVNIGTIINNGTDFRQAPSRPEP